MKKHLVVLSATALPASRDAVVFPLAVPDMLSVETVRAALAASGITPSDSRTVVHLDLPADNVPAALCLYAAAIGFLRRRPERVTIAGEPVSLARIDQMFRGLVTDRPLAVGTPVQIGGVPRDYPQVSTDAPWTDEEYALVRNATDVLWTPPTDAAVALTQLVLLTAVRCAPPKERFPLVVAPEGVLSLDDVRKACSDLRSTAATEDRSTLVARIPVSARAQRLQDAANAEVLPLLPRLGMVALECPRTARHTRPADPLIVEGSTLECSVCDPYPVDSLRVVMDTTGLLADDAAAWIMGAAIVDLASH